MIFLSWFVVELLFISSIEAVPGTVKIEKWLVPEVVQSGAGGAVLDCQYSVPDDNFTVQWLFNHSEAPVYEWSPRGQHKVNSLLDGRIDLAYKISPVSTEKHHALRIVDPTPEHSGEYTCKVIAKSDEAQQTKTMLVFSPEREFQLDFLRQHTDVDVRCYARGLYPQPELTIELNGVPIRRQQQRVWRSEGALYDAECTARLSRTSATDEVTCRLQVPLAGYAAMRKDILSDGRKKCTNNSPTLLPAVTLSTTSIYLVLMICLL